MPIPALPAPLISFIDSPNLRVCRFSLSFDNPSSRQTLSLAVSAKPFDAPLVVRQPRRSGRDGWRWPGLRCNRTSTDQPNAKPLNSTEREPNGLRDERKRLLMASVGEDFGLRKAGR